MQTHERRSLVPLLTPPDLGRTGRKGAPHTGLPGSSPLPSLIAALSRRAALFGAVTVAGVTAAALPAKGEVGFLSANDTRLVQLADAYEALDREVGATSSEAPGFDGLISRYTDLEMEAAETPADSLVGVAAKARMCQSPAARGCADYGHVLSVVDDAFRLLGGRHAG